MSWGLRERKWQNPRFFMNIHASFVLFHYEVNDTTFCYCPSSIRSVLPPFVQSFLHSFSPSSIRPVLPPFVQSFLHSSSPFNPVPLLSKLWMITYLNLWTQIQIRDSQSKWKVGTFSTQTKSGMVWMNFFLPKPNLEWYEWTWSRIASQKTRVKTIHTIMKKTCVCFHHP